MIVEVKKAEKAVQIIPASSSKFMNIYDFSPKTGKNLSVAVEWFGLCKLASSFQYLYIVFIYNQYFYDPPAFW